MKKWFIMLLTLVTFSSPIILGGCSMLDGKSEKEKMIEIAESKKMKRAIENLIKELDPKALTPEGKIKSYEIQKDKLGYNPMGGLLLYLTFNKKEKLYISMTVQEEESGEYRVANYLLSKDLAKIVEVK